MYELENCWIPFQFDVVSSACTYGNKFMLSVIYWVVGSKSHFGCISCVSCSPEDMFEHLTDVSLLAVSES